MSSTRQLLMIVLSLLILSGCATTFYGDAHITPRQCVEKCKSWGMVLDGMVSMGEYSDACVCRKKTDNFSKMTSNASGVVAVVSRMREDDERNNSSGAMMNSPF